jgi:uncharacterized protein (DUF1778 family)
VIRIRASAATKAMLNPAAMLHGQKLSEFVLESARRRAERIILDERSFFLEPKLHERFLPMLDRPAKQSKELHALMKRKPSWQRGPWNSDVATPASLADLA